MKISIITPTYNQSGYIEQTIKSVLNQNMPNLEYIIVNDGSTDNTENIVQKYKHKIIYISQNNSGQSCAINKGIQISSGDIIGYLNSDDILLPNALRNVLDFFENNPQSNWVTGDNIIIDKDGRETEILSTFYKRLLKLLPAYTMLRLVNYIIQPSTFWKRKLTNKIGLFDTDLIYTMDYDYWLRAIKWYKLDRINSPISAFRVHPQSKGGSQYKKQFNEEIHVIRKYTNNPFILYPHILHTKLIEKVYSILRN